MDTIMVEIVMHVGENQVIAAITKDAAEELSIKVGDSVTALVKSTSVMIQK
jgi:molybdopterin-binding protein